MESHLLKPQDLLSICRNSILNLMRTHNVHVSQLAREVNVAQPTMHRLLKGKTDDIKLSTLIAIADFFSVTIGELIKNEFITTISPTSMQGRNVPVLTWKEVVSHSNIALGQREYVCTSANYSEETFALRAKTSFEPLFNKDTLFIVDPKVEPMDGDYVVVFYPGSAETTMRLLVLDGPVSELKQISLAARPELMVDGIVIIGTVLQSMIMHRKY